MDKYPAIGHKHRIYDLCMEFVMSFVVAGRWELIVVAGIWDYDMYIGEM